MIWLAISILLSLLSVVLILVVIRQMPQDYFLHSHRHALFDPVRYPNLHRFSNICRNILGAAVVLLGIAMLFLPGQGILTIIVGLMLMEFPAKRRWLAHLTASPSLRKGLAFLRQKMGKPPFLFP